MQAHCAPVLVIFSAQTQRESELMAGLAPVTAHVVQASGPEHSEHSAGHATQEPAFS